MQLPLDFSSSRKGSVNPMSEAQKRAEARRAKILARGGAGLAKLASTARGEEAAALYDSSSLSFSALRDTPANLMGHL